MASSIPPSLTPQRPVPMAPPGGAAASLDANDYSRFENIGTEDEDNKMDEVEADAPPLMELVRRAEACKEQGNEKFRAGTIAEARQSYEEGLEQMKTAEDKGCLKSGKDLSALVGPEVGAKNVALSLHLNMAACLNKQEDWAASIRHASRALELDAASSKALFRRGFARTRFGLLDEGRSDLEAALRADPDNRGIKRELKYNTQQQQRAKKKDRENFKGLFAGSLYEDKEEERLRKLREAEAKEAELRVEYEAEKAAFEASKAPSGSGAGEDLQAADNDDGDAAEDVPGAAEDAAEAAASTEAPPVAEPEASAEEDAMDVDGQAAEEVDPAKEVDPAMDVEPAEEAFPDFATWKENKKKEKEAAEKAKKAEQDAKKNEAARKKDEERRRQKEERRRTAKATSDTKAEEDDDLEAGTASDLRGYRRTADGKVTTYFNNELSEEAKKLIGDITPQRVDPVAPAAQAPTPQRIASDSSQKKGSAWNAAGTWEERDMSDWAKEEFEKQLEAVTAEKKSSLDQGNILDALHGISSGDLGNPESLGKMLAIMQNVDIRITKVKKVDGDASITLVRGKPRYIFELTAEAEFEAVLTEMKPEAAISGVPSGEEAETKTKKYKGTLNLPDISSINPDEECPCHCRLKRGPDAEHKHAMDEALQEFRRNVLLAVDRFSEEFKQK